MNWIKRLFGIRATQEGSDEGFRVTGEVKFKPKLHRSQNKLVLHHLLTYKQITKDEAWFNFEVKNLSARISYVRSKGYNVDYSNGVYKLV